MSIVGLIIALGLLVDNAIVVTESIHREKQQIIKLSEAVLSGTSKVGWAITSGTVTTICAFLPMLFMYSTTGDFMRSMPITVVLVLIASLLLALTLTPMLASRFLTQKPSKIKTLQVYINRFAEKVYAPLLFKLINVRWLVVLLCVLSLAGMLGVATKVGVSLFPKAEKPMLLVDIELPPNSSLNATKEVALKLSNELKQNKLVDKLALNIGSANPRIYYNHVPEQGVAKFAQILVILKEYHEQDVKNFVTAVRKQYANLPDAEVTVHEFTQGPVTDKPITLRLLGQNLTELSQVAADLTAFMNKQQGIINIDDPINEVKKRITLND